MNDKELSEILAALDTALATYQRHAGKLTAIEISINSMLIALRIQVTDQQQRSRPATGS